MNRHDLPPLAVAALLTLGAAGIPYLLLELPVTYLRLISEDNLGEMTSFACLLLAGVLFATRFLAAAKERRNYWFLLLAVVAVFLAGEEISWGQRIIGIATPDVLREHNVQGEIDFHNFSATAMQSTYFVLTIALAFYGAVLPLAYRFSSAVRRIVRTFRLPVPSLMLMPLFIAPLVFWAGPDIVRNDEIVELLVALSMLGLAIEQVAPIARRARSGSAWLRTKAVAVPAGFVACFMLGSILSRVDGAGPSFDRQLFLAANIQLPNSGYYRQAAEVIDHLERETDFGSSPHDLIVKSRILSMLGRDLESASTLRDARDVALAQLPDAPDNFRLLTQLAEIYTLLGEPAAGRDYANQALAILDSSAPVKRPSGFREPDRRDSRPSWTERIWSRQNRDDDALHLIRRGDVYKVIGVFDKAVDQYIAAAAVAKWSATRLTISRKISQVVAACGQAHDVTELSRETVEELMDGGDYTQIRLDSCS